MLNDKRVKVSGRLRVGLVICTSAALASCGGDENSAPASPPTYGVGGTVSGLAGSGLTLKNGTDTLTIAANGSFVLPTRLAGGSGYSVTVGSQPTGPAQTCSVQNGDGTVGSADVVAIMVTCATYSSTFAYAAVPHSAADASTGRIEYFAYDAATGRLSLQGALSSAADTYVSYVKGTPSGRQLLVSTSTVIDRVLSTLRDDLTLYDLSGTTGAPSPSRQIASPGGGDLIVHPDGNDLYAPGTTVRHYSLASGAEQAQALDIGVQAGLASAITPDGRFLFVPNTGQGSDPLASIAVVSLVDPLHPKLLQKIATSIRPLTVTISRDGKLLYVTPIDAKDSGHVYKVDAAGGLTQAGTFQTPGYARSGVITTSGAFLYLASSDDNKVQGYQLDSVGGVTPLGAGSVVPAASRLVLSPDGKYLYAISTPVDGKPGSIYGFAIGAGGFLTAVPGSPFATGEREADLTFAGANP